MQFVSNIENQITNYEDYENQSSDVFMKQLEGVNEFCIIQKMESRLQQIHAE